MLQTPLHLAVITHQMSIVKKLIEGGADVNLMDRNGQTALHLACQDGDINCVHVIRDVTQGNRVQIRLDLKNFQGERLTTTAHTSTISYVNLCSSNVRGSSLLSSSVMPRNVRTNDIGECSWI